MAENSGTDRGLNTAAVIPAAGCGTRMGGRRAKQFLELDAKPLLTVTLEAFEACPLVAAVFLVVPVSEVAYAWESVVSPYGLDKVKAIISGGKRRQDSVRLGLEATGGSYEWIVIHDGVRPMVSSELIERVVEGLSDWPCVVPGLPARETVKEVNGSGQVLSTVDRERLWHIQTPQAFHYREISAAHRKAAVEGWKPATDDAQLVERIGVPVKVVRGLEGNIKITTPEDLDLARFLLGERREGTGARGS